MEEGPVRTTRAALVIAALLALAGCKQVADQKQPHAFPNATMRWGDAHAWTDSVYR